MKISSKALKMAGLVVSAAVMMVATQEASAHATFLNTVNSGTAIGATSYSRLGLNHACNGAASGISYPIVAQSVAIPTINPIISRADVTSGNLGAYSVLPTATVADYLFTTEASTVAVTTLGNRFGLVQSRDIFTAQLEQRSPLSTTTSHGRTTNDIVGWVSTKGNLGINLNGEVPFRFANVFFKKTSCLRNVTVQIPVVDICKTTAQPGTFVAGTLAKASGGVEIWVDPTLATPSWLPQTSIEAGAGTTNFTINRDPIANPYPANCAGAPIAANGVLTGTFTSGADALFDIKIQPSAADIDKLQFPGWGTPVVGNTFE